MPDDERRIILAKKELYQSGNSLSVSIPPDTLENTPFDVGEHAAIFSLPDERELAITADTRRYYNQGAKARGSRKIRENSHGTVLLTIPPECIEEDLGYGDEGAKGVKVTITVDPVTRDLFLEFPK
ncbi:hypothetical protein [Natronosalvus rutilus]|uniref:Uncharacterized protein n=1 Tax=Natronosalvus rutilus TaxID=2953753 RepID=A0A9E7NCW0_9EURY|nr:hypothetical protein [Natronosalvus rutilus]UTF55952.1 hypothetical protein NGM29_20895 [Natronosalvus rutilus]